MAQRLRVDMPKRRTAKQQAASRRNLAIARAKRDGVKPSGKMKLLYHRTSEVNANSILKHGFDTGKLVKGRVGGPVTRVKPDKNVFFSDKPSGDAKRYGNILLSVNVSHKKAKLDQNFDTFKGETFYFVKATDLRGVKVRKH